jgi:hypothetical protein
VAAPPLAVPKVAEGQFAVMIQDPPGGFPRRIQGPITNCGRIDTGANLYPQMVVGEVRYQAKILVVNVLPQPAVKEPPLQPRNFRTPWAVASLRPLDGNGGEDQPFLVAEQPQAHLQVDRADGTKGSIVGAYRVVRGVRSGAATTIQTVRELTGAQLTMAWNCEGQAVTDDRNDRPGRRSGTAASAWPSEEGDPAKGAARRQEMRGADSTRCGGRPSPERR